MIKRLFQKIQPEQVISDQLHEAKIQALQHESASEHHAALASMYRARIERLKHEQGSGNTVGTTHSS